jgi:hypothetical protein
MKYPGWVLCHESYGVLSENAVNVALNASVVSITSVA